MRNIIITGGELFNKGAQAMVFITVDEIKKRYPDHDVYILSELDLERPESEKSKYAFNFTGWYPIKFAKAQKNLPLRLMCRLRNNKEYTSAYELYSNCDLMIDISGYALGSNWSYATCNRYVEHLEFAKAFNIPVYLMPQSFGPFDFIGEKAKELDDRIRNALSYVSVICAREKDGYDQLKERYALNNIVQCYDLVLNNKGVDLEHIFMSEQEFKTLDIKKNSVGVIPNGMLLTVKDSELVLCMYRALVKHLLSKGYEVYILSHSSTDAKLCKEIYEVCSDDSRVTLLDDDFSCLEFDEIVKSFEFIIASRFHSIVHAYKNAVPCILLGWAEKYYQLSKLFEQQQYCFDFREDINIGKITDKIDAIDSNKEIEKSIIKNLLEAIQKVNVFDVLPKDL